MSELAKKPNKQSQKVVQKAKLLVKAAVFVRYFYFKKLNLEDLGGLIGVWMSPSHLEDLSVLAGLLTTPSLT